MQTVATLVSGVSMRLTPEIVNLCAAKLDTGRMAWLSEGIAADIFCDSAPDELRAALCETIGEQPIDVLVQPGATRRKKLLLADMESTIIEQEMLDELAGIIGQRDKVAAITRRAMNGELDFAAALRERVALLKGQPSSILDDVAKRITFMPGAEYLIAAMKAAGASCRLVSGGFTCFAQPIAARLGFDKVFANELVVRGGVITGEVVEPVLDKNAKKALLEQSCAELGFPLGASLAVGDGANDIPMLEACNAGGGLGVAYHAKPKVREAVANQLNHADLKALAWAQGL
jgi:phosphoserine phosphatase